MKKKFKKISKICLGVFCIAIVVLLGFMLLAPDEMQLPSIVTWAVLISGGATLICIMIAVVLDLNEGYKREKYGVLKKYALRFVVLFAALAVYQLLAADSERTWMDVFGNAVAITCATQAGEYIFAKEQ